MPGRDRDEERSEYVNTYPDERFVRAFRDLGAAASMSDIAVAVGCQQDTASRRLNELVESGYVRRRDVGGASLWVLLENANS